MNTVRQVIRIKVCGELLGSPPVLYDIVKRRFVRTSWQQCRDLSRETLNLPHMMGLPNRTLEPISRSWSFCANDIKRNPAQDLAYATIPSGLRRWALAMRTIKCLKGNWWMPWHAQAMKDVIRCDKLRGGANTL